MTTIQTVCIFVGGYLLSRLLLTADGHQLFVAWLVRRSGGRVGRIVLGVMAGAFLLSTFVPNALTVLALIPVVNALRHAAGEKAPKGFATLLAMGLIYGGNIGGLASLVGSPANLYLLFQLRLYQVPGAGAVHFVSWLAFGLPMASLFVLISWGLLRLTERRAMGGTVSSRDLVLARSPLLATAAWWSLGWLAWWIGALGLTTAMGLGRGVLWQTTVWGDQAAVTAADLAGVVTTVLLVLGLFLLPHRIAGTRRVLLHPKDLFRELPLKGILFGAGVLVVLVVVAQSGLVAWLERVVNCVLPEGIGPFATSLVVVLITIYSTEVLNNTTVSTVLFPLSIAIARRAGLDPLLLMLAVSLASTCAFMTPVATPVNALAFAGVGRVSLGTFVKNGALVNLAAALWIAVWTVWLVPPVLRWFS